MRIPSGIRVPSAIREKLYFLFLTLLLLPTVAVAGANPGAPEKYAEAETPTDNYRPGDSFLLKVNRSRKYGEYLTDGHGRPLYVLVGEKITEASCNEECIEVWPPAIVEVDTEIKAVDPAIKKQLIDTRERKLGYRQMSYNGYPLYFYNLQPAQVELVGQGIYDRWGQWYLIDPDGEPIAKDGGPGQEPSGRNVNTEN